MGVMAACTVIAEAVAATSAVPPSFALKTKFVDSDLPTRGIIVMVVGFEGFALKVQRIAHDGSAATLKTDADATHAYTSVVPREAYAVRIAVVQT